MLKAVVHTPSFLYTPFHTREIYIIVLYMKTYWIVSIIAAVAVIAGIVALNSSALETGDELKRAANYKDASYIINGEVVTLKNGMAEKEAAPGSASKIITRYFGNEILHDFDGDGREDVAFLLTQETGGSGTFYYVVAALNTADGYKGSSGVLLGDRIAPQSTNMGLGNIIVVNYAVRGQGESFADQPSIGKSIWLLLNPETMQFGEVAQDFEGEADPARMTLSMKKWIWINAKLDDVEIKPKKEGVFALTFMDDGRFAAETDCNSMGGAYEAREENISFSSIMSTRMYCDGSQEADFASILEGAATYRFTSKGELVITLESEGGSAVFR